MAKSIQIDGLASAIADELAQYEETVTSGLFDDIRAVGKECLAEVKAKSPRRKGKYRRGWRLKVMFESKNDLRVAVHNATNYQLTHLLEKGYLHRSGKRVEGKPHIAPAEQNAERKLLSKVKVRIRGG